MEPKPLQIIRSILAVKIYSMYIFPRSFSEDCKEHFFFFCLSLSVKERGADIPLRFHDGKPPWAWAKATFFGELVGPQTGILTEQAASATTTPQQLQKGGQTIFISYSNAWFPSCLKLAIGKRTKPKQTPTVCTFLFSISLLRPFSCFAQFAFCYLFIYILYLFILFS